MKNNLRLLKLRIFLSMLCFNFFSGSLAQQFEGNRSATYDECIAHYSVLSQRFKEARLTEEGFTDSGKPLHLFVISSDGDFNPSSIRLKNKRVVMILNGIHPGEPDGIDASMLLAADLLNKKIPAGILDHLVVCIIPVFNVDGALNRGCCSRANQLGPEAYGFRGNSRNLDLNRDFIKCDAANTRSFISIFRKWEPELFVDTHVSNGADYPYTMTLISTQHSKLNPILENYLQNELTPSLFEKMKLMKDEMIPYVNTFTYGESPENGIFGFLETPRYSSGYAALFNCIGFVAETHMLKPFAKRVQSTYRFMLSLLECADRDYVKIGALKKSADDAVAVQQLFPLQWELDTTRFEWIQFSGYAAKMKTSRVTGLEQLWYDREEPWQKPIRFFDTYAGKVQVSKPEYYIIPQAWNEVIEKMKLSKVQMKRLARDTVLQTDYYSIQNYSTVKEPYEGRYLHSNTSVELKTASIPFLKGDYVIEVNQPANRFVVETLEPQGVDSWFNWGFFDAVLQQKEWFSSYVFEPVAEEILKNDSRLKTEFELKKSTDSVFAGDAFSQLYFIYRHSVHFENTYKRYPVARVMKKVKLPLQ